MLTTFLLALVLMILWVGLMSAARKHARHTILIELNPDYCQLIAERLAQQTLLTAGWNSW